MRNIRSIVPGLALLAIVCGAAPALAGNVTFMKNTAISKMTDADLELLRSTARNLLDYTVDGEPRRWHNPETGATGVLTVLSTAEQEGSLCRQLEMFNEVQGLSGRSMFTFCRQADGSCKIPAK
jgi:surface antigen